MGYRSHTISRWRAALLGVCVVLVLATLSNAQAAQAILAWDPSPEPDIVGYRVHYGTSSGGYDQAVEVGKTTTATVSNLTPGTTYYFVVTAYNSAQLESLPSNEAFSEVQNKLPNVTLAETAGAGYDGAAPIALSATATDSDGSITKVEFYEGDAKIGEDATAPYSIEWMPPGAGRFQISARATDNDGGTASSNVISLAVNGRGSQIGRATYTGLVTSAVPDLGYSGAFTLRTSATGTFSGHLIIGGATYRVKGRFDSAGTAMVAISRKGAPALVISPQLSSINSSGELSGTIADGDAVMELNGDRSIGAGYSLSHHVGKWTVLLRASDLSPVEALAPKGIGYGAAVVSNKGFARIRGALADGTPFSYGAAVSKRDQWTMYIPLYKKKGALAARLQFTSDEARQGSLSGSAMWSKPAEIPGERFYPAGFHLELNVAGESYSQPRRRQTAGGVPVPLTNGSVTLSGGNLAHEVLRTFTVLRTGKVLIPDAGVERLRLQINVATGTFSGSFFDLTAGKQRKLGGALLPAQGTAEGFFLGADESGSVILKEAP